MSSDGRNIQWAMWANESALLGSWTLFFGAIVGVIGGAVEEQFVYWLPVGIYGMIIGLLIIILEYPRGKKNKGNTLTRSHQEIFSRINFALGIAGRNYYIRFLILFFVCIPAGMIVPTFFGAFCLLFASIVYLIAAIRGEEWKPVDRDLPPKPITHTHSISSPPSKPPPRLPPPYEKQFTSLPQ